MRQKYFLIFLISVFVLFLLPTLAKSNGAQCYLNSECGPAEFCKFENCPSEKELGVCVKKPDPNSCDIPEFTATGPICGCDGKTYENDCYRQAAGVSKNYRGKCINQIKGIPCDSHHDCSYLDLWCVQFPGIGKRCAEPDPCNYFDCSNQSAGSFCTRKDNPIYSEVTCTGDCQSDSDCDQDEFCDVSPCDAKAGYCTEKPIECTNGDSPVCGCDGNTYQNDCFRKKAGILKNYNGECIEQISNVSCDISDYGKDTCEFIGDCFEFPGVGKRCAAEDPLSYYPCPEGFKGFVQLMYPRKIVCRKDCSSDKECNPTNYAEYDCLLQEECEGGSVSAGCCDGVSGHCVVNTDPCPDYYKPVCGCNGITYKNNCLLRKDDAVKKYDGKCKWNEITDINCDAMNPCPESMDLKCYSFPDLGARCAKRDPCSYYECPEDTECGVTASYPGRVVCSGTAEGPGKPVTKTGTVEAFDPKDKKAKKTEVTVHTGPGYKGSLKTPVVSAKVSQKLVIEESKLMMETSAGKKPVSILPEDAIAVSETPNKKSIKEIELREESRKPVYSVKGTKQAKVLWIFPVTMEIETKVDAGTGDVILVHKPWWSFLSWQD